MIEAHARKILLQRDTDRLKNVGLTRKTPPWALYYVIEIDRLDEIIQCQELMKESNLVKLTDENKAKEGFYFVRVLTWLMAKDNYKFYTDGYGNWFVREVLLKYIDN